jgi:hypothetical protein
MSRAGCGPFGAGFCGFEGGSAGPLFGWDVVRVLRRLWGGDDR